MFLANYCWLKTFLFLSIIYIYIYIYFLYSRKVYNDNQLQCKSLGSMEMHNNPKTYT